MKVSCTTQFWHHQLWPNYSLFDDKDGVWVTSKCSTRTRLFNRACCAAIIDRVTRGVQSVTASQARVPGVTRGTVTLAVIDGRECSPCLPRERKRVKEGFLACMQPYLFISGGGRYLNDTFQRQRRKKWWCMRSARRYWRNIASNGAAALLSN